MRQPKGIQEYGQEGCCPSEWDHTPNITGDFEFDASIQRCHNKDAQKKLQDYVASEAPAYKVGNGYTQNTID